MTCVSKIFIVAICVKVKNLEIAPIQREHWLNNFTSMFWDITRY